MRELKTMDVFKMSKILKKINLEIAADGKTQEQLGAELILQIGENLHLVENEVNEFMGSLIGIPAKEFAELPIAKTLKYLEEFKNIEGVGSFFKLAGKQIKQ